MDDVRTLSRFVRPYLLPLGGSTLLTLVGTLLDLARPWPLKIAVDGAIGGKQLGGVLAPLDGLAPATVAAVAAASAVALVVAGGVVDYVSEYAVGATAERIGADLRAAVFARLQRLSLRFHDRNRTGDLVNRLTSDVSRVQDSLVAGFETLLPNLLTLTGMVVLVLVIDPELGAVALGVVPLLAVVVVVLRRRLKRAQRHTRALYGALASRATDVLRNVRVVQAFAREDHEQERFRSGSAEMMSAAVAAARIEASYSPASDVVLAVGSGLVLYLGVLQVTRGQLTLGTLLVVLSYVSSVYRPIRSLARLASTLAKGAVSRERLTEILAADEDVPEPVDPVPAPGEAASVAFRDVTFAYDESGPPVLAHVSLEVAAGETVCVVGPSGAGKSTLLALLLRLYDPDEGAIELGGVDLRRIALASLRSRIALVPQDPWMLDGTIAENIGFGRCDATTEDVRWAAHVALVDEFVDRLPHGYETLVGESGVLLSGGQRRRIALARAIVRGASLLVLDEPTTGLDAASEVEVLAAIARVARGRTMIVAAHALAIAALADRVLVLDGGRIVEHGRHDQLVAAHERGRYARLWSLQHGAARAAPTSVGVKGGELREAHQGSAEGLPPPAEARRQLADHDRQQPLVGQHRLNRQGHRWGGTTARPTHRRTRRGSR